MNINATHTQESSIPETRRTPYSLRLLGGAAITRHGVVIGNSQSTNFQLLRLGEQLFGGDNLPSEAVL